MPGASAESAASTAEAVRMVAESDEPLGALGTRLAAELYGCEVLAEAVEDRADNLTRFVWLGPDGAPPQGGEADKTSIVFWGFNDESPGALVARARRVRRARHQPDEDRVAAAAACGSGTTCSSPTSRAAADDSHCARRAGRRCASRCATVKVLGSYPAAPAEQWPRVSRLNWSAVRSRR